MEDNQPAQVPRSFSMWTFFGLLMLAMLLCADRGVIFAPLFPLGIAFFIRQAIAHFRPDTDFQKLEFLGKALFFMSYVVYVALFMFFISLRKWRWYWVASAILFCLLFMNVAGCRSMGRFHGPE